jgi:hypothetical protein
MDGRHPRRQILVEFSEVNSSAHLSVLTPNLVRRLGHLCVCSTLEAALLNPGATPATRVDMTEGVSRRDDPLNCPGLVRHQLVR